MSFATGPIESVTAFIDFQSWAPIIVISRMELERLYPRDPYPEYVTFTAPKPPPKNWRWFHRFKTEVSECQPLPAKRAEGFLRRLFSPNAVETARNKRKHWLEGLYA